MLGEDSAQKSKILEKLLELFSQLPDKEDAQEGLDGEALEGEGELEGLSGLGAGLEKPKGLL